MQRSLYDQAKYKEAINLYEMAITSNGNKGRVKHRYRLAASYTATKNFDKALDQIEIIITKSNFNEYEVMSRDIVFNQLHDFPRWINLMKKLEEKT